MITNTCLYDFLFSIFLSAMVKLGSRFYPSCSCGNFWTDSFRELKILVERPAARNGLPQTIPTLIVRGSLAGHAPHHRTL